jgi:hypothetical protein
MLALTAVLFAMPLCAGAATLADYHSRIREARTITQELADSLKNGTRDRAMVQQKTEAIAKLIPASEKVEWPGGSIETANQWLPEMLEDLSKEQATPKGRATLAGINERLQAISSATDDLIKATAADRTKDEDKQKLSEILSRVDYQKPAEPEESLFQKIVRKIADWIDSLFPRPSISPEVASAGGSLKLVLQVLLYLAVIGLLGFLVYKFAPYISARFGSRTREKKKDRVILGEHVSADESAYDLLAEAERLASEGRLREAIRKGYIAVLCDLADRKLIGLARYKTNSDYLRDIRKRADLFPHVAGLTGTYERNWYGLRPSTVPDWEEFRSRYQQMKSDV